jgi:hypothetical protein
MYTRVKRVKLNNIDAKEQQARLNKAIGHKIYAIQPVTKPTRVHDQTHYLSGEPTAEARNIMSGEDYAAFIVYLVGEPMTNGGHTLRTIPEVTAFIAQHTPS